MISDDRTIHRQAGGVHQARHRDAASLPPRRHLSFFRPWAAPRMPCIPMSTYVQDDARQGPTTAAHSLSNAPGYTPNARIASAFTLTTTRISASDDTGPFSSGASKYISRTTRR